MGEQHGESLREVIAELASERLAIIHAAAPSIGVELVEQIANGVLEKTRQMLYDVYEESRATARAANLPHWLLLVAGGFSDIIDRVTKAEGTTAAISECTLWPAPGPKGSLRLVGTWDSHATAQNALVVVRRSPSDGDSTLALSTAGWPMQQGVTSRGLAFAIANLVASAPSEGTSYICALPQIVKAATASEASSRASALPLCSARYYIFCDSLGGFEAIETDGRNYWYAKQPLAHTNHFILDEAKQVEGRPSLVSNFEYRRLSASAHLGGAIGSIDALFEALAYNDGSFHSISQYGEGRADRTCAAFVLEPAHGRISFTVGPPGRGKAKTLTL